MKETLEKKLQLLAFLPYGFSSTLATTIEGRNNPYACEILIGEGEDNTESGSKHHRKKTVTRAKYLSHKKYTRDTKRKCELAEKELSFRFLTKTGFMSLVDCPDETIWAMVNRQEDPGEGDGNIKEEYHANSFQSSASLRETLHDFAKGETDADDPDFASLLLEAVNMGAVTPMTYAIDLAPNVKIGTTKYSQSQIYNIWRQSHINAMFRVNGHLTCLDRRPYDTGFKMDGIQSPESYKAYLEKHGYTPASLTHFALTHWYKNNPGYYKINQQYPDESQKARLNWLNTPAYYSMDELSDLSEKQLEDKEKRASDRTMHTICTGLAIGKTHNYICYHAKPGEFKWLKKRETQTKENMERIIHAMKTQNPEMKGQVSVEFGLYFCSSHYQFTALFDRTIERHKKGLKANFLTDEPYTSIHAIPVNDSGTCLLWCLMESAPIETEMRICNTLVSWDIGFEHQTNHYYPLTYEGVRVFPGYTMDISKINHVLIDYLNGKRFYICCFPDQAVWYRKLFPGLTIL